MTRFNYTRKPDFKNIRSIDYNQYWDERGLKISQNLMPREKIMLGMIGAGKKVIDIGCGHSRLPLEFKAKGCQVEVADISGKVIELFRGQNIPGHIINLEDTGKINFTSRYDFIILSEVLEHTRNPEEIINKLKQFSDYFLITIPNSAFYRYRWHLMFSGRFFTQWVHHPSEHLRYWSHIDFLDWLKAMNLKIINTVASNGFSLFGLWPGLKDIWKNMFGHQIIYYCKAKK
ncbi:MAG: methyltransferase domain-containing protein [Patescibacteria group bacterium]|nr:methyltransferase domain-containing protein [Patescibacteria group bacterium]